MVARVPAVLTPDDPPFTGVWEDVPRRVQSYLAFRLTRRSIEIHVGLADLLRWLYVGDATLGVPVSRTYAMSPRDFWPSVLRDAAEWHALRAEDPTHPAVRVTPPPRLPPVPSAPAQP